LPLPIIADIELSLISKKENPMLTYKSL